MTDYKKTLKVLALLLGLAVSMPFSAQAQTTKSMYHEGSLMDDPTAKWQSQGLMNDRTTFNALTFTITNNGIGQDETPLGSGLLILGAAGAGYALAKRRKNKKNNKNGVALLMASLMLLGFTQCKKEVLEPIDGETVHITLRMEGNATRANVEPAGSTHPNWATVEFVSGDKLYVGNGGKYVGYLTYNGSNSWSGDLTGLVESDYLHLYFLGNKDLVATGNSNEYYVSISDQTSEYPVISYNHSEEKYDTERTSYSATTLYNKCSIMKFNVTTGTSYANDPIRITGMNNKVTVDFSKVAETGTGLSGSTTDNGFSYEVNSTDGGLIKMPAKDASNITWAIVLPQEALAEGAEGSAYTNGYIGNRPAISKIERNHYYAGDGIAMTINTESKIKDLATVTADWEAGDGWTLTGTLDVEHYPVKISIADGATVTLDGVTINGVSDGSYKWAGITCEGTATIILKDGTTNTVRGFFEDYPGIHVPAGSKLTIQGGSEGTGKLTASPFDGGTDYSYGAGIGGGWEINCGNIEIQGGTITATGGTGCAGIGAGNGGYKGASCGNITISGGTVTAKGGSYAAGIGSGYAQNADNPSTCGAISISGGTVRATAGALAPAAIGKGAEDGGESTCASVTITPDITSLTLTNTNDDVTGIVSDFINAGAFNADTNPITYMLPTSVTDPTITGGMDYFGFTTSYNEGAKTWTITKKE